MLSGLLLLGSYVFSRWLTTTSSARCNARSATARTVSSSPATPPQTSSSSFSFTAVISGLAGALYTPQVGIINPSEMSPEKSLEAVVWVAVGGAGLSSGRSSVRLASMHSRAGQHEHIQTSG